MSAFDLIQQEIDRQKSLPNAADVAAQEAKNSVNDHLATVGAYLFRASPTVFRNVREGNDVLENLVKAGAILVAAIEAEQRRRAP